MTNGIFIRTSKSENEVIDDCKKLIQEIKLKARLIGVKKDDQYEGIKAYFNCGKVQITELLKKKLLNTYDDTSIHSLTTALSIEDAFPTREYDFKINLQEQIQNMVPVQVLIISKVPVSYKHPEVNSGRWIIILDVPEDDNLLVFKRMGLPNRMVLMSPVDGKDLRVRFHCRLCDKDGHIQWRCLKGESSDKSIEFLFEPPKKKTRFERSDPSCSHACSEGSMDKQINESSSETIPCSLAMPEGIKNIVFEIGSGPLSVEQLEAYIIHVQKEPDPASFAIRYFTIDIDGLREQMTKISRDFYSQIILFSDPNITFMRLLRNALERLPGGHD